MKLKSLLLALMGFFVLGNSCVVADIPLNDDPFFFQQKQRPAPKPKVNKKSSNKAALTIVRVKGESRLLIPRRFVQAAANQGAAGAANTTQSDTIHEPVGRRRSQSIRTIIAGIFLSAGLVCFVLVKRHRMVVGGSLIIGAIAIGSLAFISEPAKGDIGGRNFPPHQPKRINPKPKQHVANVLGNQVSIELTDSFSVMLMLGDDYQTTGKDGFSKQSNAADTKERRNNKKGLGGFGAAPASR
jgi:hypothetical protein